MNSQFLWEKLEDAEIYSKFVKENPSAYLCSGFFMVDLAEENPENKYHFDFYVPASGKTFSFELEMEEIKLTPLERTNEKILEKVEMKFPFDFDEIKEIILRRMEEEKITNKIQKMLFSLQNSEGKDVLFGTVFISAMGLIKVNIDLENKKITDFEKIFDGYDEDCWEEKNNYIFSINFSAIPTANLSLIGA